MSGTHLDRVLLLHRSRCSTGPPCGPHRRRELSAIRNKQHVNHINNVSLDAWYKTLAREYGGDIPFSVADTMDLARPSFSLAFSPAELRSIEEQIARGGTDLAFVRKLSDEDQRGLPNREA